WDFPAEDGQRDGTLSHAIEHLYFHVCEHAGYAWVKTARPELFGRSDRIVKVETTAELLQFVTDFGHRLAVRDGKNSAGFAETRQLSPRSPEPCLETGKDNRVSLLQQLGRLYHENTALLADRDAASRAQQDLVAQCAALVNDRDGLIVARDELARANRELVAE